MSELLAALRQSPVAIERVALAIAADAYPGLDTEGYVHKLDELAAPIRVAVEDAPRADERLAIVLDHVYGKLGFSGNQDDYYDPRNSYLNDVIDRRSGIPITLAVVLIALGARLGLQVVGIGFPGHFLVRVGGEDGLFLDPFSAGNILERSDLRRLARRFGGDAQDRMAGYLHPVSPNQMALRMLYNLQNVHRRRGDHARALVVADRLVDLADTPSHRRDRGVHALALGAMQVAVDDLEAYLRAHPSAHDEERIQRMIRQARAGLGGLLN